MNQFCEKYLQPYKLYDLTSEETGVVGNQIIYSEK